MGSPLAKNNAFGLGSPSWNLSFPCGNLTAAEILAYLPHWLKSVDVIDRFVTNGGKSYTIAAMINEFRYLPTNSEFRPNSAQIMMSYGMRRAGFDDWTVGSHSEYPRPNPDLKKTDLNVQRFRAPRETHPKSARPGQEAQSMKYNKVADPVEFKDLALHVRRHPFGSDALDLARCVQYALAHPTKKLLFPDDFENLVKKLGGPAPVTHSHLDKQSFDRRDNYIFSSPLKSTPKKAVRTPRKHQSTPSIRRTGSGAIVPQSRRLTGHAITPTSGSPLKRMMDAEGNVRICGRRKSGRLANKTSVSLREYDSDATVSGTCRAIVPNDADIFRIRIKTPTHRRAQATPLPQRSSGSHVSPAHRIHPPKTATSWKTNPMPMKISRRLRLQPKMRISRLSGLRILALQLAKHEGSSTAFPPNHNARLQLWRSKGQGISQSSYSHLKKLWLRHRQPPSLSSTLAQR
jgi:hypothetical protein